MKRWIFAAIIVVMIGSVAGCSSSQGESSETPSQGKPVTIGTIQVPDGPKIKVVFNGPPELEASWEKVGMAPDGFQMQLIGTLKNVSDQSVKLSEIGFLFDDRQVGYINGQTLAPGKTMKVLWGAPGYSENTKVLEVKIKGFEKIGVTIVMPTTAPSLSTVSLEDTVVELASGQINKTQGTEVFNGFVWADSNLTYCDRFVSAVVLVALGKPITNSKDYHSGYNYAIDDYEVHKHVIKQGSPPKGAIVYYDRADSNKLGGHVGISDGQGNLISVVDTIKGVRSAPLSTMKAPILGWIRPSEYYIVATAPATAPEPAPTATPTYLAKPLENGVIMGDFSIALGQLERESGTIRRLNALICKDDYVRFYFAIRRVNDTADNGHSLAVLDKIQIIDDHGNIYSNDGFNRLKWRDSVGDISFSSLPVGFTWIEAYDVVMPMPAPIVKIQLLSSYPKEIKWEIDYQEYQIKLPNLNAGYEERVLSIGQAVSYGEYLQWSVGSTTMINQEYVIPFNLSNLDYNARELRLIISVQENDRQIRGGFYSGFGNDGGYCRISLPGRYPTVCQGFIKLEVPGQSKMEVSYQIPLGQEPDDTPDRLLILSKDEKGVEKSYIIDISP